MNEIEHVANRIDRYPAEETEKDYENEYDNGTMPDNVQQLRDAVVGHKIVRAFAEPSTNRWNGGSDFILELDNGTQVRMQNTSDCCAYTDLQGFFLNLRAIDHAIMGVGTSEGFTKWFIYAEAADVLTLDVMWSAGNPFYYGYGFYIAVEPVVLEGEVVASDQRSLEK